MMALENLETYFPVWKKQIDRLRERVADEKNAGKEGVSNSEYMLEILERKFKRAQEDKLAILEGKIKYSNLVCNGRHYK